MQEKMNCFFYLIKLLSGALFLFLAVVMLSSCQSMRPQEMISRLSQGDPSAFSYLENLANKEGPLQAVHTLNYGSALFFFKDIEKALPILNRADQLIEDHDYFSFSQSLGAFFLSRNLKSYRATLDEVLVLHSLMTLGYLMKEDFESAAVEVRRLNEIFSVADEKKYSKSELEPSTRMLMWLVLKKYGDQDNAKVALNKALSGFSKYGGSWSPKCSWKEISFVPQFKSWVPHYYWNQTGTHSGYMAQNYHSGGISPSLYLGTKKLSQVYGKRAEFKWEIADVLAKRMKKIEASIQASEASRLAAYSVVESNAKKDTSVMDIFKLLLVHPFKDNRIVYWSLLPEKIEVVCGK